MSLRALVLMLLLGGASASSAAVQLVVIEVETLSQPSWQALSPMNNNNHAIPLPLTYAPSAFPFWYAFHNGSVDTFDLGQTASSELGSLAKEGYVRPLIGRYVAAGASSNFLMNTPWGWGVDPLELAQPVARAQYLDPVRHKFLSYLAKVNPSDDAFIGNDDPQRIRIFDDSGKFVGPIVIDVYGGDVLDAGVRQNDEIDISWLDRPVDGNLNAGVATSHSIAVHPGYAGSIRNPGGTPGVFGTRSLSCGYNPGGAEPLCINIDSVRGDFTRPGYPLLRIRITSGIDGSYSGTWYDPARDGEGFMLDVAEGNPPVLSASWYTYAPDGSGRQVWLVGSGPVTYNSAKLDMYESTGGRFAATTNPANVVRRLWGTLDIGFARCEQGRVLYTPADPSYPAGDYFIRPLTPRPQGTGHLCGTWFSLGETTPAIEQWPY